MRLRPVAFLLACAAWCAAADPVQELQAALAGSDYVAKKRAIAAVADKSIGDDDTVLPLLVQALSDRQAFDPAVGALRTRTGLQPNARKGAGGYPGYPETDTAEAWNAWITARTKQREQDAKIAEAAKQAEQAKEQATKAAKGEGEATEGGTAAAGATPGTAAPSKPSKPPTHSADELGIVDRVIFRNGGSLLCFVIAKRTDPDGRLLSVRIVHQDEGGEEVLDADLIARIEEDVR